MRLSVRGLGRAIARAGRLQPWEIAGCNVREPDGAEQLAGKMRRGNDAALRCVRLYVCVWQRELRQVSYGPGTSGPHACVERCLGEVGGGRLAPPSPLSLSPVSPSQRKFP